MSDQSDISDFAERQSRGESEAQQSARRPEIRGTPVPKEWRVATIDEISDQIADGGTPSRQTEEQYFGGSINWVVVNDIKFEIDDSREKLTKEGLESSSATLWPEGSVIVTTGASIGDVGVAQIPTATKQGITGIIPNRDISPFFLARYIEANKPLLNRFAQGTTFEEIRPYILKTIEIPLPPLEEQRKIATVLSTVDQAIQKTEEIVSGLERIHQGALQNLIQNGIGHDQYENIRILGRFIQMPAPWGVTTVSEACEEIIDYRGKNPEFSENGIPHLTNVNIDRGKIVLDDSKYVSEETYDDWMTRGIPQVGDTLLSTEAPMGKTATLPELKFSLSQRLIVLRSDERFDNSYFAHLMGSPFVQKEYEARATGSTVKGISNYNLQDVTIPIPPLDEQKEIANIIDRTLAAIQSNERQAEQLNRLKQGLMQDLLSGAVRTHEADIDIPDEILAQG